MVVAVSMVLGGVRPVEDRVLLAAIAAVVGLAGGMVGGNVVAVGHGVLIASVPPGATPARAPGAQSIALTISSHIFLASPKSIIVLSRKNNSFCTPA